jgi:ABC-2 type transport system ATP-binding protein
MSVSAIARHAPEAPPMNAAIVVDGLAKCFGQRAAVDDLDFEVPVGSLAGFVDPNGAGNTTTLRMLVGLLKPTAGGGDVLGQQLRKPERYFGCVGALIEAPAAAHRVRLPMRVLDGLRGLHPLAHARGVRPQREQDLVPVIGARPDNRG